MYEVLQRIDCLTCFRVSMRTGGCIKAKFYTEMLGVFA